MSLLEALAKYSNKTRQASIAPQLIAELFSLTSGCPEDTPW
jgi:hypothetical protein